MHGQMSPRQLYPVTDNLLLKFGEDLISRRRDTGPQTLRWSAGQTACRFQTIIMPDCGLTCKLRLASWNSTSVEFQVGPSVAIR